MSNMIVETIQKWQVEYYGDDYREHSLNTLRCVPQEIQGAGPSGYHSITKLPTDHPSASFDVRVTSTSSNYFSVRRNKDIAEIINPTGQVFCSVYMGEGVYSILTEKRAHVIANILNNAKANSTL